MPRKRKTKIFVSYSRHDESLVKPLAALIGVAAKDAIFLDVEQLEPGDLWENKIVGALKESSVFVLCWCCQCEKSTFIAKEIEIALADVRKKLVPVLFCKTLLPPELENRQWIDLRGRIVHACDHGSRVSVSKEAPRVSKLETAKAQRGPQEPEDAQNSSSKLAESQSQRRVERVSMPEEAPRVSKLDTAKPQRGSQEAVHARNSSSKPAESQPPRGFESVQLPAPRFASPVLFLSTLGICLVVIAGIAIFVVFREHFPVLSVQGRWINCFILPGLAILLCVFVTRQLSSIRTKNSSSDADAIAQRVRSYFEAL